MPQEAALFDVFTIEETVWYFAKLLCCSNDFLDDRFYSLSKLMQLPAKSRVVGTLSGGQKRRLSLAMALLRKPPLLVLDEPTVGIDPLIRDDIWIHLKMLSSEVRN